MEFGLGLVIGMIIGLLINWVIEPVIKRDTSHLEPLPAVQPPSDTILKVFIKNQDDLEQINGIGPVFAQRLREAGIYTYNELANTPAIKIQRVVAAEEWQNIDVEAWTNEARKLDNRQKGD